MGTRVKKQIGYGISPEFGRDSAQLFETIVHKMEHGEHTIPSLLNGKTYDEQMETFFKNSLEREGIGIRLPVDEQIRIYRSFLLHEEDDLDTITSDIFLLTPPRYMSEWFRNDDTIDYVEETARYADDPGPVSRVTELPYDIFPCHTAGYIDINSGQTLPASSTRDFFQQANLKSKLRSHKISNLLAQNMGYKDTPDAIKNVGKLPPAEILFMAELTGFFKEGVNTHLLRPVSYIYWD